MQKDPVYSNKPSSHNDIEFNKESLIYGAIQRIFQFHHSGKLVEKLKSDLRFREIKISDYKQSNEIELIKLYPHINKQELREFTYFNSFVSSCPPKFSNIYSPIRYILEEKYFDGVSLNLRYVNSEKLIIKHNFSAEENRVNDYQTSLFSILSYNTQQKGIDFRYLEKRKTTSS